MKYIRRPKFFDFKVAVEIGGQKNLSSFPLFRDNIGSVFASYRQYIRARGGIPVSHPLLPEGLNTAMRAHYTGEINSLKFIEYIRRKISPGVCPVCGAQSPATIDHVLPKEAWPVYSFLSRNLVPACDQCNRKKGVKFFQANSGGRPIHPYYDKFLLNRIAVAKIDPPFAYPVISIVAHQGPSIAEMEVIEWHLEEVVRKTSICDSLCERWINICRDPRAYYETLQFPGVTVEMAVLSKLKSQDSAHGTPNNWESMLQFAIANNPDALLYLEGCLADPRENLA